jgi:hypothetical protein
MTTRPSTKSRSTSGSSPCRAGIRSVQKIRASALRRGRLLAQDPDYPSAGVMEKVAEVLLGGWR